jgi:transcriptional regulator with XRE-family HTH domain
MATSFFKQNLIYIRKAYGLTQKDMASKLSIPMKNYQKYEEDAKPSQETLIDISVETNIGLDMLLRVDLSVTKSHGDICQIAAKKGI